MEFYLHFQNKHLEIIIKKKLFDDLRPFFVKRMKEWNVCCYIYHVEIDELQGALITCIPSLGFILAHVITFVKKFVNLHMKSLMNV